MNEKDLVNQFQKALDALIKFRYQFLRQTCVEFKGIFPDYLRCFPDDEFLEAPVSGTSIIVCHSRKISIIFEADDGQRFSYTFPCGKNPVAVYEDILFSTWPSDAIDTSAFMGGDKTVPMWDAKDGGICANLEHWAKEAEDCLIPILGNKDYKKLAKEALYYLRNGAPKWRPCKVEWQYLRHLDGIIKRIQIESDILKNQYDNKEFEVKATTGQETKAGKEPSKNSKEDETASQEPVTLIEFMQKYCENQKLQLLKYRRKSLNDAHNRKTIALPKDIGKWKSGKKKYYNASDLKGNWSTYRETLPNLPPVKQSQ